MDKEMKREENEEVFEASDNLREVPISARAAETDSARAKVVAGELEHELEELQSGDCLLYTSPSPRDLSTSRMPSSA